MGWLSGYLYRKAITLTGGSSGALTDYQLKLAAAFVTDHMQLDFDDLRFTKEDGTTLIDAWLEDKTDGTSADVWVEFPITPANGVEEIKGYMYYGKADAVNYWDGNATFPSLSDDFEDNDVTDWSGSTMDIESTIVKFGVYSGKATGSGGPYKTGASRTDDYAIEFDYRQPGTDYRYVAIGKDGVSSSNCVLFKVDGGTLYYYDGAYQSLGSFSSDEWRKFIVYVHFASDTFDVSIDGGSFTNGCGTRGAISEHNDFDPAPNGYIEYFDNIFVRKYAANPPAYVFGSEQNAPTGLTILDFERAGMRGVMRGIMRGIA